MVETFCEVFIYILTKFSMTVFISVYLKRKIYHPIKADHGTIFISYDATTCDKLKCIISC